MRHLTVASVISSESAISVYERPTTSRSRSAIFRSTFSSPTERQTVDRFHALKRGVQHPEWRDVLERDEVLRAAPTRTEFAEDAVLRHLEEPR